MSPKITVKGPVDEREVTGKNGKRTIFFQPAQLETDQLKMQFDLECDGPKSALEIGKVFEWDVVSDIRAGAYGPQLARRMTLVEGQGRASKPATA